VPYKFVLFLGRNHCSIQGVEATPVQMSNGYAPCQTFLGYIHLVPRAVPYAL